LIRSEAPDEDQTMVVLAKKRVGELGPYSAGVRLTPREFDRADFVDGWRYELINGVLVVSPIPLEAERDPNDELGHLLRQYKENHPQGSCLDRTLPEQTVRTLANRRRADRVIWAGLGRLPRRGETPTIIAEFVSSGKRDRTRDYEEKRDEYMLMKVSEYWIIDRFQRMITVFYRAGGKVRKRVVQEHQVYTTAILPGFVLPLSKLLAAADAWIDVGVQD
jgi:Uma2 family endonuclease